MPKLKTLSILAGTIAMLAFSATPASAVWHSNSTQTTGTIHINKAGEFKYPSGGVVKCPANEIVAQWQIQGAGQIKQQQKITTEGNHLQIQVKSWGVNCLANALLSAKVSECNFQLVQQAGVFKATAGVSKNTCVLKISNEACVIQVPVGMEKSQNSGTGINVGLKEVELSNVTVGGKENQLDKANITGGGEGQLAGTGIFGSASGVGCASAGLAENTEEAELVGLEFEAEGVKAV